MFGHDVISGLQAKQKILLKKIKHEKKAPKGEMNFLKRFANYHQKMINNLRTSHHFFMGTAEELLSYAKGLMNSNDLFTGDHAIDVNLPYNKCWFEYMPFNDDQKNFKAGIYVEKSSMSTEDNEIFKAKMLFNSPNGENDTTRE